MSNDVIVLGAGMVGVSTALHLQQRGKSVALVDRNVDRHGTREVAQAYLRYLYSPEGQRIAARHYYRPRHPELVDPADVARFPQVRLVTIRDAFGSWEKAQAEHFADGGVFDQIQASK